MADGIAKNWERVVDGWKTLGKLWKLRWRLLGEAVDDKDWGDALHHLIGGFLSDALQALYRTQLYALIVGGGVYIISLTGLYNWPLSWTGF